MPEPVPLFCDDCGGANARLYHVVHLAVKWKDERNRDPENEIVTGDAESSLDRRMCGVHAAVRRADKHIRVTEIATAPLEDDGHGGPT